MLVYIIRNNVNGKIYIGLTKRTLAERWKDHKASAKKGSKTFLSKALAKHGPENFSIEEICTVDSQNELSRIEQLCIECFQSNQSDIGYNLTTGGESGWKLNGTPPNRIGYRNHRYGVAMSEETKNKISESKRGKSLSSEHRLLLSTIRKGKPKSAQHRANIAAGRLGKKFPRKVA